MSSELQTVNRPRWSDKHLFSRERPPICLTSTISQNSYNFVSYSGLLGKVIGRDFRAMWRPLVGHLHVLQFLPRDAMLARYMLRPCVRLRLSVWHKSEFYENGYTWDHTNKPHDSTGIQFSGAKDLREIRPVSPPTVAPNAGGVG